MKFSYFPKRLFISFLLIQVLFVCAEARGSEFDLNFPPPSYSSEQNKYCSENIYDCSSDGVVVSYKIDSFLSKFYRQVDSYFASAGFHFAFFEYCQTSQFKCYVDISKVDIHLSYERVKNSGFKVTSIFPKKGNWWAASNGRGTRKGMGIDAFRELRDSEIEKYCTAQVLEGQELGSEANSLIAEHGDMTLVDILSTYPPNFRVALKINFPSMPLFDHLNLSELETVCLLYNGEFHDYGKHLSFKANLPLNL